MVTYSSDELIPSSDFAKKFGSYLSQIKSNAKEKFAILKNNHIEAVLVSKEEYEKMKEAMELLEHKEIYEMVKRREESEEKVSFDDVLLEAGISKDEL